MAKSAVHVAQSSSGDIKGEFIIFKLLAANTTHLLKLLFREDENRRDNCFNNGHVDSWGLLCEIVWESEGTLTDNGNAVANGDDVIDWLLL